MPIISRFSSFFSTVGSI